MIIKIQHNFVNPSSFKYRPPKVFCTERNFKRKPLFKKIIVRTKIRGIILKGRDRVQCLKEAGSIELHYFKSAFQLYFYSNQ